MAKLDGKSQPVMIPPVLADYLEVGVGQRVVAGNFSLAHREMCFEEFRPLCSGQQFVCWDGALLIVGEVCGLRKLLASRLFKVPI